MEILRCITRMLWAEPNILYSNLILQLTKCHSRMTTLDDYVQAQTLTEVSKLYMLIINMLLLTQCSSGNHHRWSDELSCCCQVYYPACSVSTRRIFASKSTNLSMITFPPPKDHYRDQNNTEFMRHAFLVTNNIIVRPHPPYSPDVNT